MIHNESLNNYCLKINGEEEFQEKIYSDSGEETKQKDNTTKRLK